MTMERKRASQWPWRAALLATAVLVLGCREEVKPLNGCGVTGEIGDECIEDEHCLGDLICFLDDGLVACEFGTCRPYGDECEDSSVCEREEVCDQGYCQALEG